jgi:hypothetical protein
MRHVPVVPTVNRLPPQFGHSERAALPPLQDATYGSD